jgi:hypothetical protein
MIASHATARTTRPGGKRTGNLQKKTLRKIEAAYQVLSELHPVTVRQCYYQLVSQHVIENNKGSYKSLCDALVSARQRKMIPWDWIEDRLRKPRKPLMFDNVAEFARTAVGWYRRNVWLNQLHYVEVWLEKDAMSGMFEDELDPYGVTLNVGRAFRT